MKTFYGETFIDSEKLEEAGIDYPIKYEYFKQINDDTNLNGKAKFGIHIVKKEYLTNNVKVETKNIKYLTNDEEKTDRILKIFKENQGSIINCEEIIYELLKKKLRADNI